MTAGIILSADVRAQLCGLFSSRVGPKLLAADVAARIDKSEAWLWGHLDGSLVLSLRDVSDIAFALDARPRVELRAREWDTRGEAQ